MKKRKIRYDVLIADEFYEDNKWTYPTEASEAHSESIDIEFEWDEKEPIMKAADRALDQHIKENYKGKEYRIYYWWWLGVIILLCISLSLTFLTLPG